MNFKLFAIAAVVLLLGFFLERAQRTVEGNPLTQPKLDGTWIVQEEGGPLGDWIIEVSGNHARIARADNQEWYEGTFTQLENGSPQKFDFRIEKCNSPEGEGLTCLGLYEIKRNRITLAASAPGNKERPMALCSTYGSRLFQGKRK
jgi:hypothetical protein